MLVNQSINQPVNQSINQPVNDSSQWQHKLQHIIETLSMGSPIDF